MPATAPRFADMNPVFIPGPTNVPDALRRAMDVQTRDHRAPDFPDFLAPILADAARVFATSQGRVVLFPASGTGGWEAAITNTLSPGDRVLIASYGHFSNRWIDMCQRHGLQVEVIDCPWGTGAPADRFEAALRAPGGGDIRAVLVTHNETATGVRADIKGVRAAMDAAKSDALLLVDCVSSLGSMPVEMDAWGVDVAVAGSQKGFMLNTGLAVVALSPRAIAAGQAAALPRTFFSFRDMLKANEAGSFPYTPPLQLIVGLRASLDMLLGEGLDAVYARHTRMAGAVRAAVEAWGLRLVAQSPELYSDTVSAIYTAEGHDSAELVRHAYTAYGTSFGAGLAKLSGRAFRIGHLGALTEGMVIAGLGTAEMAMADLKHPVTLGAGVAAAQSHLMQTRSAAAAAPSSRAAA